MGAAILSVFLWVEARRFRGHDIWRTRVRALQKNVFAYALDPTRDLPNQQWRKTLSEDYRAPTVKLSIEESLAHRLRRVYIPLYCLLGVAWLIHIIEFSPNSWPQSTTIAFIPGVVVTAFVIGFYLVIGLIAYRPRTWHIAGEIRGADTGIWDDNA